MRTPLAVALVALLAVTAGADDPKPAALPSLKVGDPAPALMASKWLQGQAVKKFEPGKVYVVEFWATWCGSCIHFMPHTSRLQDQFRGVTFVYYTARDPENPEEKVVAFVKRRGPKLKFTFAYGDDRKTFDAWITAAGKESLPQAFVVDTTGRIAYIGHPMLLGVVLPRVLAGAKPQAVSDEAAKIWEEFGVVAQTLARDPRAGLKALADFETRHAALANMSPIVRARLGYLPKFGKPGEAKEYAETVIARAIAQEDRAVLALANSILRRGDGKESKELMALAVKAAEAMVRIEGDRDAPALIELASTYFQVGEKVKAREIARKAVTAAAGESASLRQRIEQEAKKIAEGTQEDRR
jgi:thiol-disulfide isomerase/thioredoxin